jgi:alpha-tubulin suppressor-like RCC1 family protein
MMMVLVAALAGVSSISAGIRNQYVDQIGRSAAKSGFAMANACIKKNGSVTWTDAKPLKPNTDCTGTETTSCPSTSTSAACYVLKSGNFRTLFSVGLTSDTSSNITGYVSKGIVREVRTTSNEIVSQNTVTLKQTLGNIPSVSYKISNGITTSGRHSCAIANGKAYCWGYNSDGELGNNSTASSYTPVAVSQGAMPSGSLKQIVAGYSSTCAIASDDKAYCWGAATSGQLGNGTSSGTYLTPVATPMPGGITVKQLSMPEGYNYACALASDDKVYCWGYGATGSASILYTPTLVPQGAMPAGSTVKQVAAAADATCALVSDGKIYCWGSGYFSGTSTWNSSNSPVAIPPGAIPSGQPKQISAAGRTFCAIGSDDRKPGANGRDGSRC